MPRHLSFILAAATALRVGTLSAQAGPAAELRRWADREAHPISVAGAPEEDNDLAALDPMIGTAKVVALGEPFHIGHDALAQRNRIIRYLVTKRGFTAIALETALPLSKRLYDHVLGKTTEPDSVLTRAFTYGFGGLRENHELIAWLRRYNASRPMERRVGLYGIDLTGQYTGSAGPAIESVLDYLTRVDPALGAATRADFAEIVPKFQADKFGILPAAEQDRISGKVADLVSLLRRRRIAFVGVSSRDDYEWTLRQAIGAAQDGAFLRLVSPDFMAQASKGIDSIRPNPRLTDNLAMREVAMADNVAWIVERERNRGKVFFFAHNGHLQAHPSRLPKTNRAHEIFDGGNTAGTYLRAILGRDYFVVGTYYGTAEGAPPFPGVKALAPDEHGMDGLLASLKRPAFLADLRRLPSTGPLADWFSRDHATRTGNFGDTIGLVNPREAYDAILYLDKIGFAALAASP